MKILNPRTHQVSFRLSEEEYGRLRLHCISVGERSVSDMARKALCQFTRSDDERPEPPVDLQIRQLYSKFVALSERVQELSHFIESQSLGRCVDKSTSNRQLGNG